MEKAVDPLDELYNVLNKRVHKQSELANLDEQLNTAKRNVDRLEQDRARLLSDLGSLGSKAFSIISSTR